MNIRPRLYLDVDGVLCPSSAPDPAWGTVEGTSVRIDYGGGMCATYNVIWAPALVDALELLREQFELELVWLTTWNELDAARTLLVPRLGGLAGGRMLPLTPGPLKPEEVRGWWKAERLLQDQAANPGPFIWADDDEVPAHGTTVHNATSTTSSLLIAPSTAVGLTVDEVTNMTVWLEQEMVVTGHGR
jgi:hypothetical protein